MAAYVGQRRGPLRLSRSEADARFPDGIGENTESQNAYHVLCHPIFKADGELSGVIELHRNNINSPFYAEDEEVVNSYVVWGGIALHYAELNSVMNKSKKLNEFLLDVVRSIFQDMVSMDTLIKKIMNFAQKLVDADRASLFLLDNKKQELYARLFDMGGGQDIGVSEENHASQTAPTKEIRFPIGTGIAGQVAATGLVLNIPDAYKDDRFNRNVDQITGYHTKSILCMPVFIRSTVIGVVQMVNKRSGTFTQEDEEAFQTFAVYCGLALHHAKLYDKIRRSEQKFKVALEVLSYHNTCNENEFDKFKATGVPHTVIGLDDFYFVPMTVDDNQKVHYTLYMFIDLFGLVRFDMDELYRFVLTVRKNYRRVPYHNWQHGFSVANSMYCILKKSSAFRPLECLALFIGSLCHDLDHRGRNNKFMSDVGSPLAAIYTTSTMEHHHFNQTVTILQQEGHNIFSKLSSEEYKQVLGNIKHCILATDLALFFPNKARLQDIMDREAFSWGLPDHRLLIEAIAMTSADLCASSKPWDAQRETVKVIFEEFYEQGDFEKRAGRIPIPMMDREKQDEQPASQVGFLSGICIPCYTLLESLIPESRPLLDGVQKNLDRWKGLADEQKAIKEAKAAEEAQLEESIKEAAVNGDTEPNEDPNSNTSTPTDSTKSSTSKSLQKQASLSVPVNQTNIINCSGSDRPK
ncbi:putative 3',5'-cyclic phosphodiesterase pde-5 [Orchesella cincta]|uniref:Phosphodiesterase n=1 Tax=Orchesella cincta TaxID=48709 RepID=A0A1D2ML08_ORCCI|nr:putative 3',5'-cyclic phosphodiesterase pde-5 [Orchesella cincta]